MKASFYTQIWASTQDFSENNYNLASYDNVLYYFFLAIFGNSNI